MSGVGEIQIFGAPYVMRIWLDPLKLVKYGLTSSDIVKVLKEQNAQVSAEQLGANPSRETELNASISAQSRLKTAREFQEIIIKSDITGASIFLKDVARVELGDDDYIMTNFYNQYPSAALGVKLAPGANA